MANTGYENFDLKPPRSGPDPILIALSVALVLVLGGLAFMGFSANKAKSETAQLKERVASLSQQLDAKDADMQAMIADHQAEIERVNSEWATKMDQTVQASQERLQETYATISSIVNDSGYTMQYMKELEGKVKSGKQLQEEEIAKLRAMAGGLSYLHTQYEKPIHEFRELDEYISKQMQMDRVPEAERGPLLKRIFSKNAREEYRDQVAAYYQDQGRLDAFEDTHTRLSAAYQRAQSEMAQVRLDSNKYLKDLETLLADKEANIESVESFFDVSEKILQIHQRVMNIDLPEPMEPPTQVRP